MKGKVLTRILAACLLIESIVLCGIIISNRTEIKTSEMSDAGLAAVAKEAAKVKFPDIDCEGKEWNVKKYRNGDITVSCLSGEDILGGGLPVVRFNRNLGIKSILLGL